MTAPWEAERLKRALEEIRDIASGGAAQNVLPLIAQIAAGALEGREPCDNRHKFIPHPKWPWFCKVCSYAPHEPLMHFQERCA